MKKNHPATSTPSSSARLSRKAFPAATPFISRRAALARGVTAATAMLLSPRLFAAAAKRKVVVWSEGTANVDPGSKNVYPNDINSAIAEGLEPLEASGWQVVQASLNYPD